MGFGSHTAVAVVFATASAALLAASDTAFANATITDPTGNFSVGVGPDGELFDYNTYTGFLRSGDAYDPLAPGTPRDSWGIAANGIGAYADYADAGTSGISSTESFGANGGSVVSNVLSGTLSVTQNYNFVAPNVLAIGTTVTNTSGTAQSVLFQRDIDWDVAPTEFDENSFGPAIPGLPITDSSYYGFENPDPTAPYGASCAAGCNQTGDLGGGIKLDLGTLAPGVSESFEYLYAINQLGESANGLDAQLAGLGANYIVTTQSSENGAYPDLGTNSAAIAVAPGRVPEPAALTLLGAALAAFAGVRRRGKR